MDEQLFKSAMSIVTDGGEGDKDHQQAQRLVEPVLRSRSRYPIHQVQQQNQLQQKKQAATPQSSSSQSLSDEKSPSSSSYSSQISNDNDKRAMNPSMVSTKKASLSTNKKPNEKNCYCCHLQNKVSEQPVSVGHSKSNPSILVQFCFISGDISHDSSLIRSVFYLKSGLPQKSDQTKENLQATKNQPVSAASQGIVSKQQHRQFMMHQRPHEQGMYLVFRLFLTSGCNNQLTIFSFSNRLYGRIVRCRSQQR